MKKKEWEKRLRKYLRPLPSDERRRALDYYDELFHDQYEAGMREARIIEEFGDPKFAADKIISEYEENEAAGKYRGRGKRRRESRGLGLGSLIGGIFKLCFRIIGIGIAVFGIALVWTLSLTLLATGYACVAGSIAGAIAIMIVGLSQNFWGAVALLGCLAMALGIGLWIAILTGKIIRGTARASKGIVRGLVIGRRRAL